jgi:hypothetical protein
MMFRLTAALSGVMGLPAPEQARRVPVSLSAPGVRKAVYGWNTLPSGHAAHKAL